MKTYCETQNKRFIDWPLRLHIIDIVDKDTLKSWSYDAGSWVTCACGNQCSIIPRHSKDGCSDDGYDDEYFDKGEPKDRILARLGKEFFDYIDDMRYNYNPDVKLELKKEAIKILQKIEERSKFLIKKILQEKSQKKVLT